MWLRSLLQSSATLSLYIWWVFYSYTVFYMQCVFTACYSALLQRAISSPWETGGRLFRLPQGFPAAAARLSPVSLSVDAARQPSAFIAHLAHARFDIYMADSACKHTGTSLDGGLSSQQPAAAVSASDASSVNTTSGNKSEKYYYDITRIFCYFSGYKANRSSKISPLQTHFFPSTEQRSTIATV